MSAERPARPVVGSWVISAAAFAISGFLVGVPVGFAACLALL